MTYLGDFAQDMRRLGLGGQLSPILAERAAYNPARLARRNEPTMCKDENCCKTIAAETPMRAFGGDPIASDYAKTISVGRDVAAEDLKEMDDEEIAELTAGAAREAFERMTKTRDELNESEARQEYHEEARQAFRISDAKPAHYTAVAACGQLANKLIDLCPASDELDVCLLKLREVMFWGNAAVALG